MNDRVVPTRYQCPECGNWDLAVEVIVTASVEQYVVVDAFASLEHVPLDMRIEDGARMMCRGCCHQENAAEFVVR